MEKLKSRIAALPTTTAGGETYVSHQAVTETVAACLFPVLPADQIDEAGYQRVLEMAHAVCRELGYAGVVKLTPPAVPLSATGLYWTTAPQPPPQSLSGESHRQQRFELGQVVMTTGAAELAVDFAPFLARHVTGDYGALDSFDKRQNDTAVRTGRRILSAYEVPTTAGETVRIWIITEADRSATTILLPEEY